MFPKTFLFAWAMLSVAFTSLQADDLKPFPDPQLMIDAQGFSGVTIRSLALSPDGRWLAAGGGKEVRIWNIESGRLRTTLRGYQEPMGYLTGRVNMLAFSPDSRFLVVGVSDNTEQGSTRIYDLQDLDQMQKLLAGHTGCALGVAFSPNGEYLATFGCDGHIYVFRWNDDRTKVEKLYLDIEEVFDDERVDDAGSQYFGFPFDDDCLVLRTNGKQLVVSMKAKGIVKDRKNWPPRLLDLTRKEERLQTSPSFADPQFTTPPWLRTGHSVWYARGGMTWDAQSSPNYWIALWSGTSSRASCIYDKHRFTPVAVAVNPEKQTAASADVFGDIHVWDVESGATKLKLESKGQPIYRVTWSADSKKLLFAEKAHGQSKYFYNSFGPIRRSFDLENRAIAPADPVPDETELPSRWDPRNETTIKLKPALASSGKQANRSSNGQPLYTLQILGADGPLGEFNPDLGRPYAFGFAGRSAAGLLDVPFYLGTFDGKFVLASRSASQPPLNSADGNLAGREWTIKRTFLGHNNAITSISESPDGKMIATSSIDGTIRLWKIGPPKTVGDVDFFTDGNRVESGIGPAALKAGLREKDEIVSFDGMPYYERVRKIASGGYQPGDRVVVEYKRPGRDKISSATIELTAHPDILEPLLTLFIDRNGQWVLWTEKGYYDASSRGAEYIGWHVNQARNELAKFHSAGQFEKQLYRPDIVAEVLRTGDLKRSIAAANRRLADLPNAPVAEFDMSQRSSFDKAYPPEVRITKPASDLVVHESSVLVSASVSSPAHLPLREVSFRVNGRPVDGKTEKIPRSADGANEEKFTMTVPLEAGKNVVSVHARNGESSNNTQSVMVVYAPRAKPEPSLPRLFVLSIGISKFADSSINLSYADRDAVEFAEAWKKQKGLSYREVETKTLVNEEATVGNVKDAMQWLSDSANRADDMSLVLISSHGFYDKKGAWHLALHEFDPDKLLRTTISRPEISAWMDQSVRAKMVLFIDTCHSGAAGGTGASAANAIPIDQLPAGAKELTMHGVPLNYHAPTGADLWQGSGTLVFASCLPQEFSLENAAWNRGHGAFTYAILEALNNPECDVNGDGRLSFTELELFVKDRVFAITDKRQHPVAQKPATVSEVHILQFPKHP